MDIPHTGDFSGYPRLGNFAIQARSLCVRCKRGGGGGGWKRCAFSALPVVGGCTDLTNSNPPRPKRRVEEICTSRIRFVKVVYLTYIAPIEKNYFTYYLHLPPYSYLLYFLPSKYITLTMVSLLSFLLSLSLSSFSLLFPLL